MEADATILSFNVKDLNDYLNVNALRHCQFGSLDRMLAIATPRHILIMEGSPPDGFEDDIQNIQITHFESSYGYPLCLTWLTGGIVAVGFDSGILVCFDDEGSVIFERRFYESALVSIRVQDSGNPTLGLIVWILFEKGFLISAPLTILLQTQSLANESIIKYRILNQSVSCDLLHLPYIFRFTFDNPALDHFKKNILIAGLGASLSLCNIGISGLSAKSRVGGFGREKSPKSFGSTIASFFAGGSSGSQGGNSNSGSGGGQQGGAAGQGVDHLEVSPTLVFDDSNRKILRMSVDPHGKLIATADLVGRVILFDARLFHAIRIWKGLREARLGWTEGVKPQDSASVDGAAASGNNDSPALCLVIYGPQTGLCNLWQMKHGPCMRSIPIGQQCHIYTVYGNCVVGDMLHGTAQMKSPVILHSIASGFKSKKLSTCILIRHENSRLILSAITPYGHSKEDLDVTKMEDITDIDLADNINDLDVDLSRHLAYEPRGGNAEETLPPPPESPPTAPLGPMHRTILRRFPSSGTLIKDNPSATASPLAGRSFDSRKVVQAVTMYLDSALIKVQSMLDSKGCYLDDKNSSEVLMYGLEGKISQIIFQLQDCEAAVVCVSLIDWFERVAYAKLNAARSNVNANAMYTVSSAKIITSPPMAPTAMGINSPTTSGNKNGPVAHSTWHSFKFSISFHQKLVNLLEKCGKDSGHLGVQFESEIRGSLLSAFSTLVDICNSTHVALKHGAESNDAEALSMTSSSLIRYGEWRSEAYCWASRLMRPEQQIFNELAVLQTAAATRGSSRERSSSSSLGGTPQGSGSVGAPPSDVSSPRGPVLRKGFSFAGSGDTKPRGLSNRREESSDIGSPSSFIDSSPRSNLTTTATTTALPAHPIGGPVDCFPQTCQRAVQVTSSGVYMNVCPIIPFGVFRALHSFESIESTKSTSVCFRTESFQAMIKQAFKSLQEQNEPEEPKQEGHDSFSNPLKQSESVSIDLNNCLNYERGASNAILTGDSEFLDKRASNYAVFLAEGTSVSREDSLVPPHIKQNKWAPDDMVVWDVLSLFGTPLFSDAFNLPGFSKAMLSTGLGSVSGLYYSLKHFAIFFECLPIASIFNGYFNKTSVSFLFFRWLKDTLLELFQFLDNVETEDPSNEDGPIPMMSRAEFIEAIMRFENVRHIHELVPRLARSLTTEMPTFDEVVRILFKPTWLYVQSSPMLEHAVSFCSMVLDVLEPVSDQTERRSQGKSNLKLCRDMWEVLLHQIRVVILLSSRSQCASNIVLSNRLNSSAGQSSGAAITIPHNAAAVRGSNDGASMLTVQKLQMGEISIFSLLAADTLCFTVLPDQALMHEARCLEVFTRRSGLAPGQTPSAANKAAMMASNAALLAWGVAADRRWKELVAIVESEESSASSLDEKGSAEDATKSPSAASDSSKTKDSKPPLPTGASPAADPSASKKVKKRRPILIFFPFHNQPDLLCAYRSLILANRWNLRPKKIDYLSLSIAHIQYLPPVLRAVVAGEICETTVFPLLRLYLDIEDSHSRWMPQGTSKISQHSQELLSVMSDVQSTKEFIKTSIDLMTFLIAGHEQLSKEGGASSALPDGAAPGTRELFPTSMAFEAWPLLRDAKLDRCCQEFKTRPGVSLSTVESHIALLIVLQLRGECGLRGVRPSQLLGQAVLDGLCCEGVLKDVSISFDLNVGEMTRHKSESPSEHSAAFLRPPAPPSVGAEVALTSSESLRAVRTEFINQCFHRLGSAPSPLLYRLAQLWRFTLHEVRVMHIAALLDLYLDEFVDEMIPQIVNVFSVVDCITDKIRSRLGTTLVRMDHLPACADLIPLLDPDAAAWCKEGVPAPEAAVLEAITRGRCRMAEYAPSTTKHLVIRVQALLLSIPSTRRDNAWVLRKQRCDALHGLCSFLFSSNTQTKLQRKGLSL